MEMDILKEIGFSKGEIKIYSCLLDQGVSSINKIHEKTGIERRNIYDILNKLIKKGLITYVTENKKRMFKISHPNKLLEYIDEKKNHLENTKIIIEKEIPGFLSKFNLKKDLVNGEIYRGVEGVKTIWEDTLNYPAVYWIGSGRYIPKLLPLWFENWNKKRIKLKVKWFNIMRNEMKKEVKHQMTYEKIKFLPEEFSVNPTVICIYGNKVVNFSFGSEIFAFVIESKEIAQNYLVYHRHLWNKVAKEI